MTKRHFSAILGLVMLILPNFAFAQTPTGCCKTMVGNCFLRNPNECPSPYTFYTFGSGQTACNQITECNTPLVQPYTGCCRPSNSSQSCTENSTDTTCPPPNVMYRGQICSQISGCSVSTTSPSPTQSTSSNQDQIIFNPEVPLPTFAGGPVTGQTIAEYIKAVFVYFIWTVGLLAMFMVIYGGVKWVGAAGNPGRINDARETINNALIGLVIALTSVLLLNTITPNLTKFQGLTIQPIEQKLLITEISKEVGTVSACTKTRVAGAPAQACSSAGCLELNQLINETQLRLLNSVDVFSIKAIIMVESPKQSNLPFSGSQIGGGPAYGLGQFEPPAGIESLTAIRGRVPAECRNVETSWTSECKVWMDQKNQQVLSEGMATQVAMISYYYNRMLRNKSCTKGDILMAAAAYNQGLGGVTESFCNPEAAKDPAKREKIKAKAIEYANKFKAEYDAACAAGT